MCGEHESSSSTTGQKWGWSQEDTPPDWETIDLPPDHILQHLTDAHCHPTDLNLSPEEYDKVKIGGICAMATTPEDQAKVQALGRERPCSSSARTGVQVISAFGYHPWFTHRYTLIDPPPSKTDHYHSIFFAGKQSNTKNETILEMLLPYLPDPLPFGPMLASLTEDIKRSKAEGRVVMMGEIGLDGGARMRWPGSARHLYEEKYPDSGGQGDEDWNRLTPFKVSMIHQRRIAEAQMGVAIEQGVNISFHSVASAGPTMDTLKAVREKYNWRFSQINIDIHSAGGWSPQSWKQAEKQFPNLYASPSILITSRTQTAPELIRAIAKDRILVESDSHDIRRMDRLVWAATKWVAGCRGWKVEDGQDEWIGSEEENTSEEGDEGLVWTVRTLERNMRTFLRLDDIA